MSTVELRAVLRDEISQGLKGIEDKLSSVNSTTRATSSSVDSMGTSWTSVASKVYVAQQAFQALYGPMMAVVDAAKQYDSVRTRLTATEGSALVADKDLRNLQELAKLPGLGFGEASSAMAALRSLHVSAKDTFSLIEGIARGNASMGGGAEAFGRVMYQIQQSIGKSKVSMEDLRPVMEAIPNIGSMIQEKFGSIDSDKINKQLESMGKTSKDFWMDIADMASKLPPAGDTIANNIDNIGDAWTRFKASLANTDVIKGATGALASFIDAVARRNERSGEQHQDQGEALALGRKRAEAARAALGPNATFSERMATGFGAYYEAHEAELISEVRFLRAKAALEKEAENEAADEEKTRAAARRQEKERREEAAAKEAKKRRTAEIAEAKREQAEIIRQQEAADRAFSGATGISYGSYSVAHPGGVDADGPGRGSSLTKSMVKADADEVKRKDKLRKDIAAIDKRIVEQEERTADAKVKLAEKTAKAEREAADARIKAFEDTALAGERTFSILANVAANSAGKQSAAYKSLFAVSKAFAIADAGIQISDALAKSANMPFPMNMAAMATTAALTAGIVADIQAITMGHAKGGTQMGGWAMRHESGPEAAHAIVPTQIMQASHTRNNTVNAPITVHIHGGDHKSILRTIRNATTNGAGTSR